MLEKILSREFLAEKKKLIIGIAAAVVALICIAGVAVSGGSGSEIPESPGTDVSQIEEETAPAEIIVDISGAVKCDTVATLSNGARVEDAIKAAGGVTEDADLSGINRAAVLTDGEKIYIPSEGEVKKDTSYSVDTSADDGLININEASSEELQMLSGVGPVTAEKIIAYRTTYGKFSKVEDLQEVNGIGAKTFEQIRPYIKV